MRGSVLTPTIALVIAGALALAACSSASGAAGQSGAGSDSAGAPGSPTQAAAAALAFATGSDAEVGVVDGFATLPLAVRRGQQPIAAAGGAVKPCAAAAQRPFTPAERNALLVPFQGRTLRFVADPAAALRQRRPGALLFVLSPPILGQRNGTIMLIRCVPQPQEHLVNLSWDGNAWQAVATGRG